MTEINLDVDNAKKDLRDNVQQALNTLDTIITNADTLTTAQVREAIKKLAQYEKIVIKRLVAIL
jgi:hypothetical protein